MYVHATDSLPSHALAIAEPAANLMTADAGDTRALSSLGTSLPSATDWRVAVVQGVDGLCFVRRGTGDWKGVITVGEGRVATLGTREQQASLRPALLQTGSGPSAKAVNPSDDDGLQVPSTATSESAPWQRWVAGLLFFVGLGLAMKSGSMMLDGARKYG